MAGLLYVVLCNGCATVAPLEEVRLFHRALNAVDGASQSLLDDLAVAERRQGQDNAVTKAKKDRYEGDCKGILWAEPGFIEGFCSKDAPYFAELGDPPSTHAFRQSIRLMGEYAEVLLTLAEGHNLDETSAQVHTLGDKLAGLSNLTPVPGPVGAVLTVTLGALDPILKDAAQAENVEELQHLVLSGAAHVKKLIKALRQAAPELFNTIVYQSVKEVTSPQALSTESVAEMHLGRIAVYRTAVSNYMGLLEELEQACDQLVTAFQRPRSAVSLASIAEQSAQLTAHAEAWRRVYSTLRTGSQ